MIHMYMGYIYILGSNTAVYSHNRTKGDEIGESKLNVFVHQTSQETTLGEKEQTLTINTDISK
jgi:hypothetical protein